MVPDQNRKKNLMLSKIYRTHHSPCFSRHPLQQVMLSLEVTNKWNPFLVTKRQIKIMFKSNSCPRRSTMSNIKSNWHEGDKEPISIQQAAVKNETWRAVKTKTDDAVPNCDQKFMHIGSLVWVPELFGKALDIKWTSHQVNTTWSAPFQNPDVMDKHVESTTNHPNEHVSQAVPPFKTDCVVNSWRSMYHPHGKTLACQAWEVPGSLDTKTCARWHQISV